MQAHVRGLVAAFCAVMLASGLAAGAKPWQPAAGYRQIELWPQGANIARPAVTGDEKAETVTEPVAGRPWIYIENVTRPTMTVYPARGKNTGAAAVVFPGGGYSGLAIDLEGTEVCDWLTAKGITCAVLKYRVPGSGPQWNSQCRCHKQPKVPMALQDAQRAIGLLRHDAKALGIDPHRIGVIGFSAGGHLVASVSTHDRAYAPVDDADRESPRPDFAVALYPGHLWASPGFTLSADIKPDAKTPPTLIVQAEDDPVDDVHNSLVYFLALKQAKVPAEMHLFAHGGHAFGLRRTSFPITNWPALLEPWLHTIGMVK